MDEQRHSQSSNTNQAASQLRISGEPVKTIDTSVSEISQSSSDGQEPAASGLTANDPSPPDTEERPLLVWQSQAEPTQPDALRYLLLIVAAIVLAVIFAWLMGSWFSAAVVVLAAIALLVNTTRRPPAHNYGIFPSGIQIKNRFYDYNELRSYSVLTDSSQPVLELEPSKRFYPRLSLHAKAETLEQASLVLQQFLPREDREPDLIDRFSRWLNP